VPSTCPKHGSATVIQGQQRSVAEAGELRHPRMAGGRRVLPKLAVSTVCPRCGRRVRTVVSATDNASDSDVHAGHRVRWPIAAMSTAPTDERCGAHFGVRAQTAALRRVAVHAASTQGHPASRP
jgi:hypothetical protein